MPEQARDAVPGLTGLYARALAGAAVGPVLRRVPGARRRSEALPDREASVSAVVAEREHVLHYQRVCGHPLSDTLPPAYIHLLAFPLAMELMTDARFPFGVMGLVHVRNRIEHPRPVQVGEPLDLRVRAEGLRPHDRGTQFDVVAEATSGGTAVWRGRSTYLRREGGAGNAGRAAADTPPAPRAVWQVPGDAGRRYAAVSGDRNPIHLHALTARLFGLPRPIAHGMWLKARCLAALERALPPAFAVDVRFKLPLHLPGRVAFAEWASESGVAFAVHDARSGRPHLAGTVERA